MIPRIILEAIRIDEGDGCKCCLNFCVKQASVVYIGINLQGGQSHWNACEDHKVDVFAMAIAAAPRHT